MEKKTEVYYKVHQIGNNYSQINILASTIGFGLLIIFVFGRRFTETAVYPYFYSQTF